MATLPAAEEQTVQRKCLQDPVPHERRLGAGKVAQSSRPKKDRFPMENPGQIMKSRHLFICVFFGPLYGTYY